MKRSALAIAIATVFAGSAALAQQPTTRPDGITGTTSGDSRADNPNRDNRDNASRTTTQRDTTTGNTASTTTPNAGRDAATGNGANRTAMDSTNRPDEKFLKDFAQANAAEVEAGKMAQDKAQHAEVKAFAKHMVEDHSKAITKVEAIAIKTNVDVKAKPDMMHKAKSAMLDMKAGAEFDAAYMKSMVSDHEKVVEMLQTEIRDGQDASVKQLASQALPDVQKHLKMAKDIHAKVSTDKDSSRSSSRDSTSPDTNRAATDR